MFHFMVEKIAKRYKMYLFALAVFGIFGISGKETHFVAFYLG